MCCFITDLDHGILPDQFTLTFVWIGLIGSLYPVFLTPHQSIIGAVAGYGVFWLCNEIYRFFRHRDGMYPGDFKLNAGIGACVGVKWLFIIIGISVFAMLVGSLAQFIYSNRTLHAGYLYKEIAYGCYASVVTFIVLYLMLAGFV